MFLNTTRDLISTYLSPINDTLSYVKDYAEYRFFPCFIISHVIAFVCAIAVSLTVPRQFCKRLVDLRQGKHPYQHLLEHSDQSTYSSTTTPTLAGMVIATAYAQFYVSVPPSDAAAPVIPAQPRLNHLHVRFAGLGVPPVHPPGGADQQ